MIPERPKYEACGQTKSRTPEQRNAERSQRDREKQSDRERLRAAHDAQPLAGPNIIVRGNQIESTGSAGRTAAGTAVTCSVIQSGVDTTIDLLRA